MDTETRDQAVVGICWLEELEQRTLMSIVTNPAAGALQMRLTIDLTTGAATITNTTGGDLYVDGYQITSTGGNLSPTKWRSIRDSRVTNAAYVMSTLGEDAAFFSEMQATTVGLAEANMSGYAVFPSGLNWSIGSPLVAGTASASDLHWYYTTSSSNSGDMFLGELVIVQPPPPPATTVTVNSLTTSDNTPALSGTVSDATATVSVTVNGHTYAPVNQGDGTWTLADGAIAAALADGTYEVAATATVGGQVVATDATHDELVISGGPVAVSIAATNNASEAAGTSTGKGVFTVTRAGGDFSQDLVVHYSVAEDSTATPGDDYAELAGTVTIPAGQASATIDVLAVSDGLVEATESLTLCLSTDAAYGLDAGASEATVTIADNSPTVSIARTHQAAEADGATSGKGVFTVTRTGGDFSQDLVVYYSIDGSSTATEGEDFAALAGCVTIAAGQSSATIDVLVVSDGLVESAESLALVLAGDVAYNLGTSSASMTVTDNSPTVSIVRTRNAAEANGATTGKGVFTVTRAGGDMTQDLVVYYSIADGATATEGDDFDALDGCVTIAAGQSSATIDVLVVGDGLVESTETLALALTNDAAYILGTSSASMTISDNSPTVSIVRTRNAAEANGGTTGKGVFTVTRTGGDMTQDLVVYYSIADGSTATEGEDFDALAGCVTIAAGESSATIDVLAVDDALAESTETLSLSLTDDPAYNLGTSTASMTIADNSPTVSITRTRHATETGGQTTGKGVFTITRTGDMTQDLVVYYTIANGSTATEGDDFNVLDGCVTIAAGQSSATIDVLAIDDALAEPVETLTLVLSEDPSYVVDADTATLQISDSGPTVSIVKVKDARETAGLTTGRGAFTVTRAGGNLSQPLVVNYTVDAASTASDGDDYVTLSGTVTIPAGRSSATFYVQAIDDSLAESAETLTLGLTSETWYKIAPGKASAGIVIADNEPTVSLVKTHDASEAAAATRGRGTFTVTRAGGSVAEAIVVYYTIDAGSTAASGADYLALSGSVAIPAGRSCAVITVQAIEDALTESTETLTLSLSSDAAYRLAAGGQAATMQIADNSPTVSIVKTRDAREACWATTGRGTFTVTRAGGNLAQPLVVNYSVAGGTAGDGDYSALSGSVTIPAGKSSALITVQAVDDALAEWTETLTVTLAASTGYRLAPARTSATMSIFDNEPVTLARVSAPAPVDDLWQPLMLCAGMNAPAPVVPAWA